MKNAEIREMATDDLKELIVEEKERYWRMKMAHAVSPLERPHQLKEKRRYIARLLTELRRRELEQNPKLRKVKRNKRKLSKKNRK